MRSFSQKLRSAQRGQAILIIALAMVGLAAFVGLMVDVGVLFIEYGKLKRGIDSASIAAAQQFRQGFVGADLATAAQNFLLLNETAADQISIYRCKQVRVSGVWVEDTTVDGTLHDASLCTTPRRKLIRVDAERLVRFSFLRVIGINETTISASSVGEAASIDLVLVIDTSSSMSYETGGGPGLDNNADDPSFCNDSANATPCQPLTDVKQVALDFLGTIFFPYDRVSVVASTNQTDPTLRTHETVLALSDDPTAVAAAINSLQVFEPPNCVDNPAKGFCRVYDDDGISYMDGDYDASGTFVGLDCLVYWNTGDPSSCPSSNIGGALLRGASEFAREPVREESLWIAILLAGGPANATDPATGFDDGYCPSTTWSVQPWCRDASAATRHGDGDSAYDADDFARDQADFVADPVDGQGVTIFTIGLGNFVQNAPAGDPDAGEQLLDYIAEQAGDSTASPPAYTANHGFYSYAPTTAELDDIFDAIAANIFTRIAQ